MPLRILFWNHEYFPSVGGVERHTALLAQSLASRGHRVVIVTRWAPGLKTRESVNDIEVFRLPFHEVLISRDLDLHSEFRSQVKRLKQEFSPQIVHVNLADASPLLHLMTTTKSEATIVAFHWALYSMPGVRGLVDNLARRASALVAPSVSAARRSARFLGLADTSVIAIEHGSLAPATVAPLEKMPLARFLFVGRIVAEKGVDIALRALRRLHDKGIPAEITIAGSGPLEGELQELTRQLGLNHAVRFVGTLEREELARAYENASAVVVPSMVPETFCLVAAEAALAGRPAIVSAIGALTETVVGDVTGLVFQPGDDAALARLMIEVISTAGLAHKLGQAGRARALDVYSIERMTRRYEELYGSVLAGASPDRI